MPFVELSDKTRIYFRLIPGPQDRPYLVFLHEGLGSVSLWKDFPEALCHMTGCPGMAYDRAGFGRSSREHHPRTVHYLHRNALVELPAVLAEVIQGRPFFLVGQSDGASIALIHAAERPTQLKGVIAEAPHVMVEPMTIAGIVDTVQSYGDRFQTALTRHHGEKAEAVFNAWQGIWLSRAFRHWNIEYLLPSIQCPCLILQGKDDPYGTQQHARRIVSKLPGTATLELLDNCGHAPHRDAATVVLRLAADFIARHRCG